MNQWTARRISEQPERERDRETDRDRETERDTDTERDREISCVLNVRIMLDAFLLSWTLVSLKTNGFWRYFVWHIHIRIRRVIATHTRRRSSIGERRTANGRWASLEEEDMWVCGWNRAMNQSERNDSSGQNLDSLQMTPTSLYAMARHSYTKKAKLRYDDKYTT